LLITTLCIPSSSAVAQAFLNRVASPSLETLFSVDIVCSYEAWAVGTNGTIIKWDGIKWSVVESPTAATLKSIDMISSNDGWAVAFGMEQSGAT